MENFIMNRHYLYEEPEIAATTVSNEADAVDSALTPTPFVGLSGGIVLYDSTDIDVAVSPLPTTNVRGSHTNEVFTITVTNKMTTDILATNLTITDDFRTALGATGNFSIIDTPNAPRYKYLSAPLVWHNTGWVSGDLVTLIVPDNLAAGDAVVIEINTKVNA